MEPLSVLAFAADLIGVLGAAFAAFAWYQAKRLRQETKAELVWQNQHVSVVLRLEEEDGARQIELPVKLRRHELTRAELLGRLGMIPMKDKGRRFSIDHLSTPAFLDDLNRINAPGGGNTLVIPCSHDEIHQFDIPATSKPSGV